MRDDLVTFYKNKTILITGATGFVGKAILWQLLNWVGNEIDKVYVLIRPKRIPAGTPSQRIIDEIINTQAFKQLFNSDKEVLRKKLIPISYDLSLPQMGLSMEDNIQMKDTSIAIHCASTSEYEASLEWNLETNVLGTIRLMEYLDGLTNVCSFVHLSPIHLFQDVPEFCYDCEIKEYVYDLGFGDPDSFLKQLLGANEKELANLMKRILQKYSTLYFFTKALVEHLILKRVQQMKTKPIYPITIFRSNYIGPAVKDPVPGWTTGMSSVSLWLALFGHSIPIIQPDQGQKYVNVTPVDYVSQSIVSTIPHLKSPPKDDFILPLAQIVATMDTSKHDTLLTFPYIYHIATSTHPITWFETYSAIQDYWSRPNNRIADTQKLTLANDYFSSNTTLYNAKFLLNYYFRSTPTVSVKVDIFQDQQKLMELASNIKTNLTKQNRHNWKYNADKFNRISEKLEDMDWYHYYMQSCYGVHVHTLHCGPHVRTSVVPRYMDCALYAKEVVDVPFHSVVYTQDDMRQRVDQMMQIVIQSLKQPVMSRQTESQWKTIWIEHLNDILEDWCSHNQEKAKLNVEDVKVIVLNDPQVGKAIQQLSERSGMPHHKVLEEAKKALNRIQQRTQPTYMLFAASFLQKLFKKMFSGIYIAKKSLEKIRKVVAQGKKIVYVPVSKTALDPVIVWFLAIRYNLPVPAMILDEALAVLGPFSDLLRLSGAVFVKRDPHARSTLSSAVTSAYLRHLLTERGALTLIIDQVRSRTGMMQPPFNDGLIDMIDGPDIVYIPITICYEEILDIAYLVDQDLQIHQNSKKMDLQQQRNSSYRLSTPQKVSRPSDSRSHRVRSRSLGTGIVVEEKHTRAPNIVHAGKLLVGIGEPVTEWQDVQKEQKRAVMISPVSIVAAILLYSRVTGNSIDLEQIKNHLTYLADLIKQKDVLLDIQEFESSESVVFYSIRLLEKNLTLDERNSGLTFRTSTRTDCILQLAYYANQLRQVFVLDSIFAVTYLSFGTRSKVFESVFSERFEFLSTLFHQHFNTTWDIQQEYEVLKDKYSDCICYSDNNTTSENGTSSLEDIIEEYEGDEEEEGPKMLQRLIQKLENGKRYNQLSLLASFVYPIIDTYWVTLCGLSALNFVGRIPISLVPTLSQWIGMHLVSGRRTIYGEVLSIEYHQHVLRSLLGNGDLQKEAAKDVLSPDTQMLLQVLGLSTNDQVISYSKESNELYKKIEQVRVRLDGNSASIHIYEKCQNQIKSLIKSSVGNKPFTKSYGAIISDPKEESMLQLAYALIQTMNSTLYN